MEISKFTIIFITGILLLISVSPFKFSWPTKVINPSSNFHSTGLLFTVIPSSLPPYQSNYNPSLLCISTVMNITPRYTFPLNNSTYIL